MDNRPVYNHPYDGAQFIASIHLFGHLYDVYKITKDYRTKMEYLVRYGNQPWQYSTCGGDRAADITKYKGNNLLFMDSAVCRMLKQHINNQACQNQE